MSLIFDLIKNKKFDELFNHIKSEALKNETIDLDIYDSNNNYFIQYIVLYNLVDILKFILLKNQYNIRLDILDNDGRTLLYNPIKYNYIDILLLILEYDKKNIGLSIIDIKDNNNNTCLDYSIIFNNIKALNLIYNKINEIEYNVFELCLKYKRSDILIHLLDIEIKKQRPIGYFINKNGESILQSAIKNDDNKVLMYIINNKSLLTLLINNKEHEYGLNALQQSIILNNNIYTKLIENKADINQSDYLGNTSLHYSIIEKNYKLLEYIINNTKDIYYNETNLNGNTSLHLLLEEDIININIKDNKYDFDLYNILLTMIKNTDINIMNNEGNSILYYIIIKKLYLLDKIKEILINSNYLNLYITNKRNQTLIDIADNDLINIVIKNILINNPKMNESKAKKELIEYRYKMPNNIKNNQISFDNNDKIYTDGCFYTGSTLDIVFGLLYLHKTNNIDLLLEYPLSTNSHDFNNIEIVWSFMKISYPKNFDSILQNRINNDKQFIIIPLGIEVSTGYHANIIIIDKVNKTIERFEPNGKNPPRGFYYNPELLDSVLIIKFNTLLNYTYNKPNDYLPTIGFQILEIIDEKCKKIGDPNGFCAVWCIWWAEQRIKNPDIKSINLANELIKQIKFSNKSFKKLIRNYSINIVQLRDEYLKKYNINIDDWLNNNNNIIEKLEKDIIEKLN